MLRVLVGAAHADAIDVGGDHPRDGRTRTDLHRSADGCVGPSAVRPPVPDARGDRLDRRRPHDDRRPPDGHPAVRAHPGRGRRDDHGRHRGLAGHPPSRRRSRKTSSQLPRSPRSPGGRAPATGRSAIWSTRSTTRSGSSLRCPAANRSARIQLTGGGTRAAGLLGMMQATCGRSGRDRLAAVEGRPLGTCRSPPSRPPTSMGWSSAPIGLALPEPSGTAFNLLPDVGPDPGRPEAGPEVPDPGRRRHRRLDRGPDRACGSSR